MKRNGSIFLLGLLLVLATGFFSGCRTMSSDRYGIFVPEDEPVVESVVASVVEPVIEPVIAPMAVEEEKSAPRTGRRWFGSRRSEERESSSEEAQGGEISVNDVQPELVDPSALPDRYLLRVGDQLNINVTGSGLNEQLEMPVDENGEIKLRFIGSVRAAGRSLAQLEREIELEYTERQRIYREVFVRVNVPYTFYFIGGEVRQPGRYPLSGRVTLSQAIVAAGNFTEWARRDGRLTLVRNNERIVLNFRDILDDPNRDIELRTGDVITVERSFL